MTARRHLIIGIGSPFGDDRAGWQVIERLRQRPLPEGVELLCLDRPGPALIAYLQGAACVTLIDAVYSPAHPPGCCLALDPEQLAPACSRSSHGFGLADSLALARTLARWPAELELYGITLGQARADQPASPAVGSAAVRLADRLWQQLQDAVDTPPA